MLVCLNMVSEIVVLVELAVTLTSQVRVEPGREEDSCVL